MSMNLCCMSGYGVRLSDLYNLLKTEEEGADFEADLVEIVDEIKDDKLRWFVSPDDEYVYIPDISPFGKPLFNGLDEINNYFYEKLKPYLKDNVPKEKLFNILCDVFDYDYC